MSGPAYFWASVALFFASVGMALYSLYGTEKLNELLRSVPNQIVGAPGTHFITNSGVPTGSAGSATSGKLFRGNRIREFDASLLQHGDNNKDVHIAEHQIGILDHIGDLHCNHWSVVTTIFEPSEAVRRQAQVENWCLVIVGDKKGPKDYPIGAELRAHNSNHTNNVRYLTVDDQRALEAHLPLLSHLPWNHFGRKNAGYLYAILHGATVIWDFDDDNLLLRDDGKFVIPGLEAGSVPKVRRLSEHHPTTIMDSLSGVNSHFGTVRRRGLRDMPASSSGGADDRRRGVEQRTRLQKTHTLAAVRRELADNQFVEDSHQFSATCRVSEIGLNGSGWPIEYASFNPYTIMGAPSKPSWPRGLPLDLVKKDGYDPKLVHSDMPLKRVGVVQSLANGDPDVDAIYRLTQPLPFSFPQYTDANGDIRPVLAVNSEDEHAVVGRQIRPLLVPRHAYVPYNAQATLHLYPALWSLLLPVTIHGRVSDIWRGYLAQKLFRDVGLEILFSAPLVRQDRNVHNYIGDLDSEGPLYTRAHVLVSQLQELELKTSTTNFPGRMEELWVWAYERDYLQIEDVRLCQSWLESLQVVGYTFPTPL